MPSLSRPLLLFSSLIALCQMTMPLPARGEITLDGTLGASGALPGPDYDITADLGRQQGGNLFHSFGSFNVLFGESATFSGPASVQNIIARVTDGNESLIDGLLRSTIPGADLFLLNPAGFIFGPHASLDLQGSFHVSTADHLALGESGRFSTSTSAASVLTADPPAAFGFLTNTPAGITFEGSGSADASIALPNMYGLNGNGITVPGGENISIIGGDIHLEPGTLFDGDHGNWAVETRLIAPGGRIDLVSVASAGELPLDTMETNGFSQLGDISVSGHDLNGNPSTIDVSGSVGGKILIRGNLLVMDGSQLCSDTKGVRPNPRDEQGIDIGVATLELAGGATISARTFGPGQGGDIAIHADDTVNLSQGSWLSAATFGSGNGGSILVDTTGLSITGRSSIQAGIGVSTAQSGIKADENGTIHGGTITVRAKDLTLANNAYITAGVDAGASGQGGFITIQDAEKANISGRGGINASNFGFGDGGSILVEAATLSLSNYSSFQAGVGAEGTGNGGSITVQAKDVTIADGGYITTSVDHGGVGHGGAITIHNADTVRLSGGSGLYAHTSGVGDSGSITLQTKNLTLADSALSAEVDEGAVGHGGDITIQDADRVSISGRGGIAVSSKGAGDGGSILVDTTSLSLTGHGTMQAGIGAEGTGIGGGITVQAKDLAIADSAYITASLDAGASGHGGDITIQNADRVSLSGEGAISVHTSGAGDGGSIRVQTKDLTITSTVGITASVEAGGSGRGGDITIQDADTVRLSGGGKIAAFTSGPGAGGAITIQTKDLTIADDRSNINAETDGAGNGGSISIEAANRIHLSQGGLISTGTHGNGQAGNITIQGHNGQATHEVVIEGYDDDIKFSLPDGREVTGTPSGIYLNTEGSGNGGSLDLQTDRLEIRDGGTISAIAGFGTGNETQGGNLTIDAGSVHLTDGGLISAATFAPGKAGSVTVNADSMTISGVFDRTRYPGVTNPRETDKSGINNSATHSFNPNVTELGSGGFISVTASDLTISDQGEISVATEGQGNGGDLFIQTGKLTLESGGSVTSSSTGTGLAGTIDINAGHTFHSNQGRIAAEASGAGGGDISLKATDLIHLVDSAITTSVRGGDGNGGNITIDPQYFILDHSRIEANAWGGNGGNIHLSAGTFIKDQASTVSASSALGIEGVITVASPTNDVIGMLTALPDTFLPEVELAGDRCAARTEENSSSLVVEGSHTPLPGEPLRLGRVTPAQTLPD